MSGLLFLAIAPSAFLLWYIWKKDSCEPEPLHLVAWVFFLCALSVIPAGLIELLFPEGVILTALVAPVVEELAKFLVVCFAVYHHPEFDEPVDGIIYATAAGLGFATIENILYVLEGGIAVGIIRAIVSVPGHVIFSCIWGFALGRAKFRPGPERAGIVFAGLAGAVFLHGIFNFSLEVFEVLGLLLILVVIIPLGWWMTSRNIRSAHADPASACPAMNNARYPEVTGTAGRPAIIPILPVSPATPPASGPAGAAAQNGPYTGAAGHPHRFCTHCGAPHNDGMRFCENCGREF
jgi:RsiW-degrading membrane proteinase PrsW (M82 family)